MNGVLVNGFHCEEQLNVVRGVATLCGVENLHCVTTRRLGSRIGEMLPESHLLFWEDLFWGGTGIQTTGAVRPVTADLLRRMAQWETIILKMMDRFEFLEKWDYGRRKRCYLEYLQFWQDYLIKHQIVAIVSQNIPHEVFDFVLYALARETGIQTLMFYQSQIADMVLPYSDHDGSVLDFKWPPQGRGVSLEHFPSSLEAEIQKVLHGSIPFYMRPVRLTERLLSGVGRAAGLLKKILNPASRGDSAGFVIRSKAFFRRMIIRRQTRKLWRIYERLSEAPDFSVPYCYLALHYQPELTTSPLAGQWVDQELIIGLLASCLPSEVHLYVKEHPKQGIVSRDFDFYRRIRTRKNVHLIGRNASSFDLIDNAKFVATCTGTVGWEALVRGKPVLVFGYCFYRSCPGAFPIETQKDLEAALGRLCSPASEAVDLDTVRRFLMQLNSVTIKGFVDPVYRATSSVGFESSNENIVKYIDGHFAGLWSSAASRRGNA